MTLLLLVPAILIFLLCVIFGAWRGFKKSVIGLLTLAIAFVAAIFVSRFATGIVGETLAANLTTLLFSSGAFDELFAVSETLATTPEMLITLALVPVMFTVVFVLFALISLVLYKIISAVSKRIPDIKNKLAAKGCGALVGVLCAALIIVGVYMPIAGYDHLAASILHRAEESHTHALDDVPQGAFDTIYKYDKSVIFKITDTLGGRAMFEGMTSGELFGEKVTLASELYAITDIVFELPISEKPLLEYSDDEIYKLNCIVTHITESQILTRVAPEILSGLSCKWLAGETFLGLEKINFGDDLAGFVDKSLAVLATSTPETVEGDLRTFIDFFGVLVECEVLENMSDSAAMMQIFTDDDVIADLVEPLNANERTKCLSPEIANIALRVIYNSLSITSDNEKINASFTADLANAVMAASGAESLEKMAEQLVRELSSLRGKYALDTSERELDALAVGLSFEFYGRTDTTEENVGAFLLEYASYINGAGDESLYYTPESNYFISLDVFVGSTISAPTSPSGAVLAAMLAKGESVDGISLEYDKKQLFEKYKEKNKDKSEEPTLYTDAKDGEGFDLNTRIPTQDKMLWDGENADSKFYRDFSKVVANAASLVSGADFSGGDLASLVSTFGSVFDGIAGISDEMSTISDDMVRAAFILVAKNTFPSMNTETVLDMADGLISLVGGDKDNTQDKDDDGDGDGKGEGDSGTTPTTPPVTTAPPVVTTVPPVVTTATPAVTTATPAVTTATPAVTTATPVVTTAPPVVTTSPTVEPTDPPSGSSSYEDVFGSTGRMLEYIKVLTDEEVSAEDKNLTLNKMIRNLDRSTTYLLSSIINEELLASLGMKSEYCTSSVEILSKMFLQLALYDVTPADRDAAMILMNLICSEGDVSAKTFFNTEEGGGAMSIAASYLIEKMNGSSAVSSALADILLRTNAISYRLTETDCALLLSEAENCKDTYLKLAIESVCRTAE